MAQECNGTQCVRSNSNSKVGLLESIGVMALIRDYVRIIQMEIYINEQFANTIPARERDTIEDLMNIHLNPHTRTYSHHYESDLFRMMIHLGYQRDKRSRDGPVYDNIDNDLADMYLIRTPAVTDIMQRLKYTLSAHPDIANDFSNIMRCICTGYLHLDAQEYENPHRSDTVCGNPARAAPGDMHGCNPYTVSDGHGACTPHHGISWG